MGPAAQAAPRDGPSGREALGGLVEVDETYVGGDEPGLAGRKVQGKSPVAIAVEVRRGARRETAGRVRMSRLPELSKTALEAFVAGAARPQRYDPHRRLVELQRPDRPLVGGSVAAA